jgi:FAD-binding domain
MSALHYPPLWWWCWSSLLLWAGERAWRALVWLYINGFLGRCVSTPPITPSDQKLSIPSENWELHSFFPDVGPTDFAADLESHRGLPSPSRPSSYASSPKSKLSPISHPSSPTHSSPPPLLSTFSIPVGYAHAELLAGRTIRLRLVPPGRLTWAPGQHFLLCIPSVSKLVSHPFTCTSVCDQKQGDDGRMIMFLIRAKNGWTKDLWTTIVGLLIGGHRHPAQEAPMGTTLPTTGVLLKAWVDGPFGSPARINWSSYSAAMIVSGGSGVSFGIAVLEYLCLCMAGRNGRSLGGNVGRCDSFPMQRIRFIWILRDFGKFMLQAENAFINDPLTAHMQWCASILHRCKLLVPQEVLRVDLFVTNFSPLPPPLRPPGLSNARSVAAPGIPDASSSRPTSTLIEVKGVSLNGDDLISAQATDDSLVDLSFCGGDYRESAELGHEEHWLDLTNFDGENDDRMPGESSLNRAVKREGTIRRAITRKTMSRRTRRHPDGAVVSGSRSPIDLPTPTGETGELLSPKFIPLGYPSSSSLNSEDPGRTPTSSRPRSLVDENQLMEGSQDWKRRSIALMQEASEEVKLEIGGQEMRDVSIMAEFARQGRPKLDLILRDEVAMASGRIVVACEQIFNIISWLSE